ncbi:sigma 54-interacting transcriptional regulator [Kineobactrum salinum]|uniref:Response regulator n=1 Tax=Kineobactrum salinum TaxID=2708301 RepID=A0A6C0U5U7_9GAMM|nr:sigma 54-interacting transcriptional regulator [Kineobactrum salinum]QIB67223.1 response regulator [Kineobactrum salinum]
MTADIRVLVVDDDPDLLQLLAIRLQRAGMQVETVDSAQRALASLQHRQPSVMVSDLKMDGMDGLGLLEQVGVKFPLLPVVLLTAHGTIPDAVAATKQGAFAFLTKPLNAEELIATIKRAARSNCLASTGETEAVPPWRQGIVSRSAVMESLLQQVELIAASNASIIIESESGTGKEVLARAIHTASPRAQKPFVALNCTAIPEELFESEMFGHVKGAFTGAARERDGYFQSADGGTLFLDEVAEMPLPFQAKLLRVLQEMMVQPLGSDRAQKIDVRIISATNRNLEEAIANGSFREDLYYRLSVVNLQLPSLGERREDIPLLANHFLELFRSEGVARGFTAEAMELLLTAPWPGNVRQLANVVQQCVVLCRSELIPADLVERALRRKPQDFTGFADARDQFELEYLNKLLHTTQGNIAQAARLAQRNRSEFYKLLKKHELNPADYRPEE